ncbi:TPA: hypothetical protein QB586_001473 [Pasteurella multocida]|nr:hypothetical protein [Pasteurella multocida]HDR1213289.1 hypothetical protein [Pasteurella multocida]HDR1359801.1 hypothetical protein [Pasteurella multocida]HDR1789106.1 hypothetical protein [Pasteurella multocida]HEA3250850.1 hypothetical protein [Pasteurella multocida]
MIMSEEKTSPILTALFSLFPILLLLSTDIFALFLSLQTKVISHLAFAVLIAQLCCILVFTKGQICLGQRGRLSRVNLYFVIFWGVWLLLSLFSNYHFILTDMLSLCGIAVAIAIWQQPEEAKLRRSMLFIASLIGGVGCLCYCLMFIEIPPRYWGQYSLFAQVLVGIILANLALVISRNRLQGFIGLLPFLMLIALLLNAISVLSLLLYFSSAVDFVNQLAFVLYFVLHLVIAMFIAVHIFKKWAFSYTTLSILLFMSASLPLWASFAFIR